MKPLSIVIKYEANISYVRIFTIAFLFFFTLLGCGNSSETAYGDSSDIIINEIMYHPPNDLDNLQYIELFNRGRGTVDISGWSFTKGIKYTFPKGTKVAPGFYVVICRELAAFRSTYGRDISACGNFTGTLSHRGEKNELSDSLKNKIDMVKYSDRAPWPVGPDGYSPSLERINSFAESQRADNWVPSKLYPKRRRPGGTPGKQNDNYLANLPPTVSNVEFSPKCPSPKQKVTVRANIEDDDGLKSATLLYRIAKPGSETAEKNVPMKQISVDKRSGTYEAVIPAQPDRHLVRFKIKAVDSTGAQRIHPSENEPCFSYSYYIYANTEKANIPFGFIINIGKKHLTRGRKQQFNWSRGRQGFSSSGNKPVPPRGNSAFIYVPPNAGEYLTFDHVRITQRKGGYKVHFHKRKPLRGMTTINIIFEYKPRFVLSEALSYEVYRMAGVPAELTEHIRLWVDDQLLAYHLLIEQPNKSFLARNRRDDTGNLYKLLWYEEGVIRKHEKKTNKLTGHDDIVSLIRGLNKVRGEKQWEYIKQHFNVEEFINYFAVNMCISNWDGFFNNYFAYHDINGTGKWEIIPWDEDKTWGFYDDASPPYAFYDMPLTFGMNGDQPPESKRAPWSRRRGGWGGHDSPAWWRPAGYFSGPLLANLYFRKQFLARLKEVCMTIFTEEKFFPIIDAMERRLEPEVRIRAEALNQNSKRAVRRFKNDMQSFRAQVTNRRKFILSQPEIQAIED